MTRRAAIRTLLRSERGAAAARLTSHELGGVVGSLTWLHGHGPRPGRKTAACSAVSFGFVLCMLLTGWPAYRTWATFVIAPSLLALAAVVWVEFRFASRPSSTLADRGLVSQVPLLATGVASLIALVHLTRVRHGGLIDASLSEVRVVERMGHQLLASGTPYIDTAALGHGVRVFDYSPYSPAMSVVGIPAAAFGHHPWTDARVACLVLGSVALAAAVRMGRTNDSTLGWWLLVNPLVLLMATVSGTDVGVLGLIVLGVALLGTRRPGWAGICLGVAVGMKLTAAPVVFVAGAAAWRCLGPTGLKRYGIAVGMTTACLVVPVYLAHPAAFIDNVVRYPAGLTVVASSAASPLPGRVLADVGGWGRPAAILLLVVTAVLLVVWVCRHPPADTSSTFFRAAVVLAAATVVMPASRFGYAVYPLALWGASLLWSPAGNPAAAPPIDQAGRSADTCASQPDEMRSLRR